MGRMTLLGVAVLAAGTLGGADAAAVGEVQHYLLPIQLKRWNDGLGGHVVRSLPVLDAGLMLGMKFVCDPEIFFNGKSEDPYAFSTLVGCVNASNPNTTAETAKWGALTDWVDQASVASLPRLRVDLCNLPSAVERRTAKQGPAIFEVLITGGSAPVPHGSLGGPWLRKQFHAVRRERARLVAAGSDDPSPMIVDGTKLWGDTPAGHRVLVHYRTGMWSLMPVRRYSFATHFEAVSRILSELEERKVISRKGAESIPAKLILMAALIEDDQAIERTKHEVALIEERYPGIGMQRLSEKQDSRMPDVIATDLDVMTSADFFVPGTGQWSALAALLQNDEGVHIYQPNQKMDALFQNTLYLTEKELRLPKPGSKSLATPEFTPQQLAELCRDERFRKREESAHESVKKNPSSVTPPKQKEWQDKQIKMIRDRPYRGPLLPGEKPPPPPPPGGKPPGGKPPGGMPPGGAPPGGKPPQRRKPAPPKTEL